MKNIIKIETERLSQRSSYQITKNDSFKEVRERATPYLLEILEDFLRLDGKLVGREFQFLNPHRNDGELGSCSFNIDKGCGADFASDDVFGDIFELVAFIMQVEDVQAKKLLTKWLDAFEEANGSDRSVLTASGSSAGVVSLPVPFVQVTSSAASPTPPIPTKHPTLGVPVCTWDYRTATGDLVCRQCRFEVDGKKEFRPISLNVGNDGQAQWQWKAPATPRRLYGLDRLATRPDAEILFCEGEKAADAAQILFPQFVCMTTMNGAKSPGKSDFTPLIGRRVRIAPDFDEPGEQYKDALISLLSGANTHPVAVLRLPAEQFGASLPEGMALAKGYDLADALDAGWTAERISRLPNSIWEEVKVTQPVQAAPAVKVKEEPTVLESCIQFVQSVFDGHLVYVDNQFYGYKDGYWPALHEEVDIRKPLLDFIGKKAASKLVGEMTSLMKWKYAQRSEIFCSGQQLMCLANGVLNPATGVLQQHSAELMLPTKQDIEWNSTAACPLWLSTLDEIFEPDVDKAEKISFLQEFMGYCLIPDTRQHKFLWLVGAGGNGKSLFLAIIEAMVGRENTSHAQIEALSEKFVRAELQNKLINISSEMSAHATVADGPLKQIVAGDPVQAERKFQAPFSFKPFVRLIGATNELPRLLDHSDGFFRRAVIVTFNRRFSEAEQDRDRERNLLAELPGILQWAVTGLQRLQSRGYFEVPPSSTAAVAQYRVDSDPIKMFAEECLERDMEGGGTSARLLYGAYATWCRSYGHRPVAEVNFSKRLLSLSFAKSRKASGVVWQVSCTYQSESYASPPSSQPQSISPLANRYSV